jgi:hypothetical protein
LIVTSRRKVPGAGLSRIVIFEFKNENKTWINHLIKDIKQFKKNHPIEISPISNKLLKELLKYSSYKQSFEEAVKQIISSLTSLKSATKKS